VRSVVKVCFLTTAFCVASVPLMAQAPVASLSSVQKAVTTDASTAHYILEHPRVLARFLGLSAPQTTSLLGFWGTYETTVKPLWQARAPICDQFRTDLAANPSDPTAVGNDSLSLYANKQERVAARGVFDTSLEGILNPNQLALYEALKTVAEGADPDHSLIGVCPPAS
jgi:hypothetical protein